MTRVLILSAPFGAGHTHVARALACGFQAEGAEAEVVDHFERFVSPAGARAATRLFWVTLRWAPALWGLAYRLSGHLSPSSPAMLGIGRLGAGALRRYLAATRPDAVVHVHPTPAGAMAWLRARGETLIPHGIVFTDFVAHAQWAPRGLDRYFVPDESVRAGLVAWGIPADRVVASGLPVDPTFEAPADAPALRAALGIDPTAPTVLVMAGMRGALGGIADTCDVLATLAMPFTALVVCGDHAALGRRLAGRLAGDGRFRIMGRVSEMAQVMGAADLVVTKAGAVTCAEALALGRPLVFYRSLPGQETANEALLTQAGAAVRASDRRALALRLAELLLDCGARDRMTTAARQLQRPGAGRVVVKQTLGLSGAAPGACG